LPESQSVVQQSTVIAFAQDWDTDPTSKHHLMRLLSRRRRVLWVEATGMRAPALNWRDLRRIVMKLRKITGRFTRTAPAPASNFSIISPPTIPLPASRLAQFVNARLYGRAIRRAVGVSAEAPVLWVYMPIAARFLDQIDHGALIYHCVDRWWEFEDYDHAEMRACHEILCARADHVFVSSRELERDCIALTSRVTYVPHGVDWEHFRTALEPERPAPVPARRVTVGFVGLIEEWIDVELMAEVARRHPEADLLVVGAARVPVDQLRALPNVQLVGRQPFATLPGYLGICDVALIPFRINALTRAVNPLKLREYLSAGVPVVSTALPELLPFEGTEGIDIAHDREQFLAAVARRLAQPATRAERLRLSDTMRPDGWEGRLETMLRDAGMAA
jgi:glycosyltransferase involved in cell wall biosynthesis